MSTPDFDRKASTSANVNGWAASLDRIAASLALRQFHSDVYCPPQPLLAQLSCVGNCLDHAELARTLDGIYGHHLNCEARDLAFDFGRLAGKMHHWRQACRFYQASLESCGPHGATFYNLGMAYWQLGKHNEAEQSLARALEQDPDRELYRQQQLLLQNWRKICRALLPGGLEVLTGSSISGSVLGRHHAEALCRQHRFPEVPRLAGVPQLRSVASARSWIDWQTNIQGKITLAILHADYGLIGSVALEQEGSAALFYYWIGADFQGQGFGSESLRLICSLGNHLDVKCLYAPVNRDNQRSRHVLEQAGFQPLPFAVEPSAENVLFYHRALGSSGRPAELPVAYQQLLSLLHHAGSELTLIPNYPKGMPRC